MRYMKKPVEYTNKAITFLINKRGRESRLKRMLFHPDVRGYPRVNMVLNKDVSPTPQDRLITIRLIEAYKKASIDEAKVLQVPKADIWDRLKQGSHADFIRLLQQENADALAYYLCNMARMGASEGLVQGKNEYKRIISNGKYRSWLSLFNADKLICLAEALGILPCENPEQGRFGWNIHSDIDEIAEKIERYLQIKIIPPDIEGGLYKLRTKKGSISNRDIFAVYTAYRIKEVMKGHPNPVVCEIGAGIGKCAYYAHLFGIKNSTAIDLPHVNVLQGFYVIKSLPSAKVTLYGENKAKEKNAIAILPYWSLNNIAGKCFDLTLNSDSFPEISREIVVNYLNQIKRNTRSYFLSINQESQGPMSLSGIKQNIVSELIKEVEGFELVYRFPFWLRQGYVEELYKIS